MEFSSEQLEFLYKKRDEYLEKNRIRLISTNYERYEMLKNLKVFNPPGKEPLSYSIIEVKGQSYKIFPTFNDPLITDMNDKKMIWDQETCRIINSFYTETVFSCVEN